MRGTVVVAGAVALVAGMTVVSLDARAEGDVLTISGRISGEDDAHMLSLDELGDFPGHVVTTSTIWTEGEQVFRGISGADLAERFAADGVTEVHAVAVNDYEVVIPFDIFSAQTTLIAYERNGSPMSVREKGPLWIVFPYDQDPSFRADSFRSYSIWSLTRVEFR